MTDPEKLYPELVFQTARSGGAGGQNVNKVETKVELRFDIAGSAVLTEEQKEKLYVRLASKLTNEKVLVLYHQTERSQLANKEKVIVKFYELIKKAFTDPKKRRPTRPTLASKKERLESKQRKSETKATRRKVID
ncbi:alternative ribosome rescue aminoacyl-tRNA hydrolase ArfB [Dyadobacter sp. 32]|uniref:alternative ribosome rescue aminoacyl-tRNA hydrolase ArfB n=1 Tax=Dyadobacter sp. 32 TaxID=538966 RepID=UPI0011EC0481